MINTIKKILKSSALGRWVYPALNKVYRLYSVPARKRCMKKYGYQVLDEVNHIAQDEGIKIFPIFGTLLGFVRDKGFIKGDDDIDWGVMPTNLKPAYIAKLFHDKYGMTYRHGFSYQGNVTEFCMSYKGVSMDFFFLNNHDGMTRTYSYYWKKESNYTDSTQNNTKYIDRPEISKLKPYMVHDVSVMIPEDEETELEAIYGKGWKVPDPSFTDSGNSQVIHTDEFGRLVSYDELIKML